MQYKIVNKTIVDFVENELYLENGEGTFLKVLFNDYKLFSYKRGEKPLAYKMFRRTLEKILENKTNLVKKNNCYFLNNVIRKIEGQQINLN